LARSNGTVVVEGGVVVVVVEVEVEVEVEVGAEPVVDVGSGSAVPLAQAAASIPRTATAAAVFAHLIDVLSGIPTPPELETGVRCDRDAGRGERSPRGRLLRSVLFDRHYTMRA
jgi:hypothetical protein